MQSSHNATPPLPTPSPSCPPPPRLPSAQPQLMWPDVAAGICWSATSQATCCMTLLPRTSASNLCLRCVSSMCAPDICPPNVPPTCPHKMRPHLVPPTRAPNLCPSCKSWDALSGGVVCTGGDGVQLPLGREAADGDAYAATAPDLGQVWAHHGHLGLLPF